MNRVFIRGCGAVSPAGWGVPALLSALEQPDPIPGRPLEGPSGKWFVRTVPTPVPRPACLQHPRLRRASAISQFATAAAFEALGSTSTHGLRIGIVVGVHAASIRYSERFFGEALRDPATASPLLFPETVINAPASHIAAALGSTRLTYSVVGDQTAFFQALLIAAGWLTQGRADLVLAISSEETAWTVSSAARNFSRSVVCGEGAGALCLTREPGAPALELSEMTDSSPFSGAQTRASSATRMAAQLPPRCSSDFLCDSRVGVARWDRPETDAWAHWPGPALSPRRILGESFSAATAWQFVVAAHRLLSGSASSAVVSAVGSNHQAIGARLTVG